MTEAERLIRDLTWDFFSGRNFDRMEDKLSLDFSYQGNGMEDIAFGADACNRLKHDKKLYGGIFSLSNERFHTQAIDRDTACVAASCNLHGNRGSGDKFIITMRFTAVLRRENGDWRLVHLHTSVSFAGRRSAAWGLKMDGDCYEQAKRMAGEMAAEKAAWAQELDTLTGIYNLEGFVRHARIILDGSPNTAFAMVKFSVNHFRFLNESYGYAVGDRVLQSIAGNLSAFCGHDEICARVEKDNFAMLLRYRSKEETDRRMEEIRRALLDGELIRRLHNITLTGGVYRIAPGSQEEIKGMLDKALLAQGSIKHTLGQSRYAYYSDEVCRRQRKAVELVEAAPEALRRGEFQLYIQPQVDIQSLRPVAGEALVRWVKADGTIIPPGEFIPLFEQTDFVIDLDFYMLDKLCAQMRRWMDQGLVPIPVSINQSRRHIRREDYLERFTAVVDCHGIPHEYLAVELTESVFIECDSMLPLAGELHKRNFQLEIDDFGTGYASLNLLGMVAADVLKIDRCLLADFKTNPRGRTILRKAIEMGRETEMRTICEGVETEAQLQYLRQIGCDMGQGFYFFRPMPAAQFEQTILRSGNNISHKAVAMV